MPTSSVKSQAQAGESGTVKREVLSAGSVGRNERRLRRRLRERTYQAREPMCIPTPIRYRLEVPVVPVGPNSRTGLLRMHWAKRSRYNRDWAWLLRSALGNVALFEPPPKRQAEVRITQIRKRLMDPDNAVAACKPILDACVSLGLIEDDDQKHVALFVDQEMAKGREPQTIIEIRW
jgi:hypothetical protein